jgi:D-glycero-D-manno-heptose 1,7-bisphosphate phosphatase
VNRALFLDRDGVIDALVQHDDGEWGAPLTPEQVRILPGTVEAMKLAASNGWLIFVVTNQPDAAKGKATQGSLHAVHEEVLRQLGPNPITEFFYCFHRAEDLCACRKPSPYFVQHAARYHDVDLAQSWFAGDSDTDLECGARAGCRTALIDYEHSKHRRGAQKADRVCADLPELVRTLVAGPGDV